MALDAEVVRPFQSLLRLWREAALSPACTWVRSAAGGASRIEGGNRTSLMTVCGCVLGWVGTKGMEYPLQEPVLAGHEEVVQELLEDHSCQQDSDRTYCSQVQNPKAQRSIRCRSKGPFSLSQHLPVLPCSGNVKGREKICAWHGERGSRAGLLRGCGPLVPGVRGMLSSHYEREERLSARPGPFLPIHFRAVCAQ